MRRGITRPYYIYIYMSSHLTPEDCVTPYGPYDYDFFPRMPPQDPEPKSVVFPSIIEDFSRQGMNIYLLDYPPLENLSGPLLPHRGSINFVASTLDSFGKVYDLGLLRSQPSIISFTYSGTESGTESGMETGSIEQTGPLIRSFPLENLAYLEEIQFRGVMPPFSREGIEALSEMLLASNVPQVKLTLFPSFSRLCLSTRLFFRLVSRLPKVSSVDIHLLNLPRFDVDSITFGEKKIVPKVTSGEAPFGRKVTIFSRSKDPIELVNLASANFEVKVSEG